MSFSIEHDWAPVDTSSIENVPCPKCQSTLSLLDRDENPIYGRTYYAPRHIPPVIWGICPNEECELCEKGVQIHLSVKINVELVKL